MTRIGRISGWLVVLVFANALSQTSSTLKEKDVATKEDYAIFAAALTEQFGKRKPDRVLLRDHTSIRFMAAEFPVHLVLPDVPNVPKDAEDDFESRNRTHEKIEGHNIRTAFEVVLLDAEDEEKLVKRAGGCEDKAPITFVSRPGLNTKHNRALLYVGTACGVYHEDGSFILLGKEGGDWRVLSKRSGVSIEIDPKVRR